MYVVFDPSALGATPDRSRQLFMNLAAHYGVEALESDGKLLLEMPQNHARYGEFRAVYTALLCELLKEYEFWSIRRN